MVIMVLETITTYSSGSQFWSKIKILIPSVYGKSDTLLPSWHVYAWVYSEPFSQTLGGRSPMVPCQETKTRTNHMHLEICFSSDIHHKLDALCFGSLTAQILGKTMLGEYIFSM
jgi:hypothetical protein